METIFVADDDHGKARVGNWQGPWAESIWQTPTHLIIKYAHQSRIFKKVSQVGDIQIDYQEVP